jgi:hypothetical protein
MKKYFLSLVACAFFALPALAQNVGINADASLPNANAILDIKSGNKGLLIPRMDAAARNSIPNTRGLLVYDTVTNNFWYNTGSEWQSIATNSLATSLLVASGPWLLTGNAGTSDTANFLGTTDNVALNIRVNNQAAGRIDPRSENTSWGYQSLVSNTTGTNNTASGFEALKFNNTGVSNTAHGTEAMFGCNTGSYNTGVGYVALRGVTNSNNNTAVGATALASTRGDNNSGVGSGAMFSNTLGTNNAALGYKSLYTNSTGTGNTAIGTQSLFSNTVGILNTSIGFQSMYSNIDGGNNTAGGYHSLFSNTSGAMNTAYGVGSLQSNTLGGGNIANGYGSLSSNTIGNYNAALGGGALEFNTEGSFNIAVGINSLASNTIGNENTSLGYYCMLLNTTGNYNTALGDFTLFENTSGIYNVAIGIGTLSNNMTGDHNTAIGEAADVSSGALTNATAIGANAIVDASNKVRIGNSAVTVIEGQVPFTTPSDGRYKFNVREDVKGLDFILHLRPVTYQFDTKRFDAQMNHQASQAGGSANYASQTAYDEATRIRRTGFIAQEVEQAANASGYDFSGIIKPKTEQDHYSLSYDAFVLPLVKAVQEQQQVIREQDIKIAKQQQANDAQGKQIADMQQQIDEIKKLLKSSATNSSTLLINH